MGDKWGGALARNAEHWLQLGLETDTPESEYLEAVEIATEGGTEVEIAGSNGNYGAWLVRKGRLDEAREHLLISLQLLVKTRVRNLATYTLDQVADLCVADGDARSAARLMGAAQALRARVGAPLAQVHLTPWTKLVERGKSMIGEESFDESFEAGSKLGFRSAMREAMGRCAANVPSASIR
jgi:hypothetical protein